MKEIPETIFGAVMNFYELKIGIMLQVMNIFILQIRK